MGLLKLTPSIRLLKQGSNTFAQIFLSICRYESLLNEMMQDFPKMHADLIPFVTPLVAVFCKATSAFWEETAESHRSLPQIVRDIPTGQQHGYPSVITPVESSAMLHKGMAPTSSAPNSSAPGYDPMAAPPAAAPTPQQPMAQQPMAHQQHVAPVSAPAPRSPSSWDATGMLLMHY